MTKVAPVITAAITLIAGVIVFLLLRLVLSDYATQPRALTIAYIVYFLLAAVVVGIAVLVCSLIGKALKKTSMGDAAQGILSGGLSSVIGIIAQLVALGVATLVALFTIIFAAEK